MNIKQKLAIFVVLFMVSIGPLLMLSKTALAAPISASTFSNGKYTVTAYENGNFECPSTISAAIAGTTFIFRDENPCDDNHNFKTDGNQKFICNQGRIDTLGINLKNVSSAKQDSYSGFIFVGYSDDTTQNCNISDDEVGGYTQRLEANIIVRTLKNPNNTSTTASDTGNTCESNNSTGLEWLFCGLIRSVDKMVSWMNDAIIDQLNFNVQENLVAPTGIKIAWNIFKNIATVVLVIVMLVMIFSQAIGGGPFDAYTVRKLLPKIVAAVILMQLSWVLLIWGIQLANDVGNGIGDLLAAPFGGKAELSLDNLLGGLGTAAPGATLLTALTVGTLAVVLNPFGVLIIGLAILVAVFTGLAMLLFRTILIIAAVITVPLALVAWILPGTQRYWKLWWDNFLRLLILFPIIVAVIYAGRIFAWIVASKGGKVGPLDLFAVVVGYFGPLLLLPRAYTWGGSLMRSGGELITRGGAKLSEVPKKQLESQKEARYAQKEAEAGHRWSRGEQYSVRNFLRGDYLRAGQWTRPFYRGKSANAIRARQLATLKAKGASLETEAARQEEEEYRSAATDIENRVQGWHPNEQLDKLKELYDAPDTTKSQKRAILGQMLIQGESGYQAVLDRFNTAMATGDKDQYEMMNKFIKDGQQSLFPAIPQIYKAADFATSKKVGSTITGLKAETVGGLRSTGVKALLETLDTTAAIKDKAGNILEPERGGRLNLEGEKGTYEYEQGTYARQQLSSLMSVYHEAMSNPNTAAGIARDVNQEMRKAAENLLKQPPGRFSPEIIAQANDVIARVDAQTGSIGAPIARPAGPTGPDTGSDGGDKSPDTGGGGGNSGGGSGAGGQGGGPPRTTPPSGSGRFVPPGGASTGGYTGAPAGSSTVTAEALLGDVKRFIREENRKENIRNRQFLKDTRTNAPANAEGVLDVRPESTNPGSVISPDIPSDEPPRTP